MNGRKDFTIDIIEKVISEMIGDETSGDGVYLQDRLMWVSQVNMIRMTCQTCGTEFVGPDYNVYHMLATHDFGHRKELEMAELNAVMGDDDDEPQEGGAIL